MAPDGAGVSLRELAGAAGVSVPTLRHYFGDRDGVVRAALTRMAELGAAHVSRARVEATDQALGPSLRWLLGEVVLGWGYGVGAMWSSGLQESLGHGTLGPAFVDDLLEPTLQATEARLAVHQARGELDAEADVRHAALQLVCPVLMGLLHQDPLGGAACRPLDVDAFLDDHVARFVRAWSP
jgi:AcrR family transcriptional regulator